MSIINRGYRVLREEGVVAFAVKSKNFLYSKLEHYEPLYIHQIINNLYWESKWGKGTPVMYKDWDNLIVLDACRYDSFSENNPFSEPVQKRVSLGSNTTEFLMRNFSGEQCHDTVYVTANPKGLKVDMPGRYEDEQQTFYQTISLLDEWDPETHTVMPGDMTKRTLRIQEQFPDKRLLIHFVQPHLPYIGERAREVQSKMNISIGGWETEGLDYTEMDAEIEKEKVSFDAIQNPEYDLTVDDFRRMYDETLEVTLSSVEELVDGLEGKTAITADHGEAFGERAFPFPERIYGHPKRRRLYSLCIVPWIQIETGSRKTVTTDEPVGETDYDEEMIENRLKALGYT
jgi:hypothetical protein